MPYTQLVQGLVYKQQILRGLEAFCFRLFSFKGFGSYCFVILPTYFGMIQTAGIPESEQCFRLNYA